MNITNPAANVKVRRRARTLVKKARLRYNSKESSFKRNFFNFKLVQFHEVDE